MFVQVISVASMEAHPADNDLYGLEVMPPPQVQIRDSLPVIPGPVISATSKLVPQWLPSETGSVLGVGLVGLLPAYCDLMS